MGIAGVLLGAAAKNRCTAHTRISVGYDTSTTMLLEVPSGQCRAFDQECAQVFELMETRQLCQVPATPSLQRHLTRASCGSGAGLTQGTHTVRVHSTTTVSTLAAGSSNVQAISATCLAPTYIRHAFSRSLSSWHTHTFLSCSVRLTSSAHHRHIFFAFVSPKNGAGGVSTKFPNSPSLAAMLVERQTRDS